MRTTLVILLGARPADDGGRHEQPTRLRTEPGRRTAGHGVGSALRGRWMRAAGPMRAVGGDALDRESAHCALRNRLPLSQLRPSTAGPLTTSSVAGTAPSWPHCAERSTPSLLLL